jgi:hypothetical protein
MLSAASLLAMLSRPDAERVLSRLPVTKAASLRSASPPRAATADDLSVVRRFLHEYGLGCRAPATLRVDAAHNFPDGLDNDGAPPFHFLQQSLPSRIVELLGPELPQTIAVVLGKLPASKAADVLALMQPDDQVAVVRHMACADRVPDEVLQDLAASVRQNADTLATH